MIHYVSAQQQIKEGDKVKVKSDIGKPKYDWGKVKKGSVGIVKAVVKGDIVIVDFPEQAGWKGLMSEMEIVERKSTFTPDEGIKHNMLFLNDYMI